MRYYVVFFDSSVEEDFKRRVQMLEKTAGLPTEVVCYIDDSTNGQLVGMYITEQTANRFPQFLAEFNGGEWLDHEPV